MRRGGGRGVERLHHVLGARGYLDDGCPVLDRVKDRERIGPLGDTVDWSVGVYRCVSGVRRRVVGSAVDRRSPIPQCDDHVALNAGRSRRSYRRCLAGRDAVRPVGETLAVCFAEPPKTVSHRGSGRSHRGSARPDVETRPRPADHGRQNLARRFAPDLVAVVAFLDVQRELLLLGWGGRRLDHGDPPGRRVDLGRGSGVRCDRCPEVELLARAGLSGGRSRLAHTPARRPRSWRWGGRARRTARRRR